MEYGGPGSPLEYIGVWSIARQGRPRSTGVWSMPTWAAALIEEYGVLVSYIDRR